MTSKLFNTILILFILLGLTIFGGTIIYRDPFFHYHGPISNEYTLNGGYARHYNDGFIKYFDYDSIILGTSMCNNFRTSTLQELFGVDKAIKVSASGSYFNETTTYLQEAFSYNNNIKVIVRSLDCDCLNLDKNAQSIYAQEAFYLRDKNIFNDVNYILNKTVMLESLKTYPVDWDEYLSWREVPTGKDVIITAPYLSRKHEQTPLTDDIHKQISENINKNIVEIMKDYPDTQFYLFFTPYSICEWADLFYNGNLDIQIEAQKIAIEAILQCENAHLFSFCNNFDMVCDLDNYIDTKHYAYWVNDDILYWMYQGNYQLTYDNYNEYLEEIKLFYTNYPYEDIYPELFIQ